MNRQKLVIPLERDEDGYPPVDYEGVWIKRIDSCTGIVDNIPFFARVVSLGDTVSFRDTGSELAYDATIKRSGNSLLRVLYYEQSAMRDLRRDIEALGCETEVDATHRIIAVSVPPRGRLADLQRFLAMGEESGLLGYEEAILASE